MENQNIFRIDIEDRINQSAKRVNTRFGKGLILASGIILVIFSVLVVYGLYGLASQYNLIFVFLSLGLFSLTGYWGIHLLFKEGY